jgi:spore coat polysaccharide biosynthesis predicted glycosyltransferase SpsG
MNAPTVELFCDGGPEIGYGHIRRTLTLSETLRKHGTLVRVSGISKYASSLLPPQPALAKPASVVVLDAPYGIDQKIHCARELGVVALDWFGDCEPDVAIAIFPHKEVRARMRSYIGFDYQMIRTDIIDQPRNIDGEGVLIVLGGGDKLGQGPSSARQLSAMGFNVTLIQGPLCPSQAHSEHYEILTNPNDLPVRLAMSGWVVTNGGGCMFEAMYLGKPIVVLPQTEAENSIAKHALARRALLGVGLESFKKYDRESLWHTGRSASVLIDGQGAKRVAEIVGALL